MNKGVSNVEDTAGPGEGEKEVEVEAGGVFWVNGLLGDTCRDTGSKGHCANAFQPAKRTVKFSNVAPERDTIDTSNRYYPLMEKEETLTATSKPMIQIVGSDQWKQRRRITPSMKGKITVDSGAADSVMPLDEAGEWFPMLPKKEGVRFCAANGQAIENYGRRNIAFKVGGGRRVNCMTFHATNVKKTLASVSKMVERGNSVHFTPEGSYVEGAQGERIPLTLENGVYVMDIEYLSGFNGQA